VAAFRQFRGHCMWKGNPLLGSQFSWIFELDKFMQQ